MIGRSGEDLWLLRWFRYRRFSMQWMTPADCVRYFREAAERYGAAMKEQNGKGDLKALFEFERLEVVLKRREKL